MTKNKILIRLVSDVHLEARGGIPKDIFPDKETDNINKIVILAGDIGDPYSDIYKEFLNFTRSKYDMVIIIAGNHEYYNDHIIIDTNEKNKDIIPRIIENEKREDVINQHRPTMYSVSEVNKQMEKICEEEDCIFLNNSCTTVNNRIKFIGTTLWSNVTDTEKTFIMNNLPNVLKYTRLGDDVIDTNMFNRLHKQAVEFLNKEINDTKEGLAIIVITHYAPSYKMISDQFIDSRFNNLFASNLETLFVPPVVAWVSGHLHNSKTIYINNIESSSNSFGHDRERIQDSFYRKKFSIVV